MPYLTDEQTALMANADGGTRSIGIFWRLATDPALHIWLGSNDIPIQMIFGVTSTDPAGTIYRGAGRMLDMPETLDALLNGIAENVEFSVKGLTADQLNALEVEELPSVTGKKVNIGFAPLDRFFQPRCPIIPLWEGTGDYIVEEMQPVGYDQPRTYKLGIACHAGDSTRARPRRVSWSHAAQQLVSAGDQFFNRVMRYVGTYIRIWPRS